MGGGKITRPGFGLGQPDPGHPMTEFYTLLLEALSGAESFALPGLYARRPGPSSRRRRRTGPPSPPPPKRALSGSSRRGGCGCSRPSCAAPPPGRPPP